jgi:hypothetical protein
MMPPFFRSSGFGIGVGERTDGRYSAHTARARSPQRGREIKENETEARTGRVGPQNAAPIHPS